MHSSLPARLLRFTAALLLALATACSVSPEITFDPGTDFKLNLASPQVALVQGGQASLGVQVAWLGNCGCPDVQLSVKGAPAGLSTAFDANPTATGTTLLLGASPTLPAGTYPLTLTGVRGTLSHSQTVEVQVSGPTPDYSVRLTPAYLAIGPGGSGTVGVELVRTGGFAEAVTLSLSGAPAGVTASFPALPLGPLAAPAAGAGALVLTVAPGTAAGTHRLSVTATSASRVRTAPLLLEIQALADFTLALSPTVLNATSGTGGAGPATVTLTRAAGFTSAVALSLEGAPAGCTGAFAPASVAGTASTLGLTLAGVAPGSYTLTVRGTATGAAGIVSRTATLLLTVTVPPADFTVAPVSVTAVQGGGASAGVVLGPLNGFTGPVTLSASGLPAGVTTAFAPNPATPASGSTLTVSVPASLAPGTYTGTLRGVSGALDHTAALTLTVQPPADFTLSLSPSSSLSLQVPYAGKTTATSTLLIQGSGGFTAPVTLEAVNPPAGVTVTFSPNPATGSAVVNLEASPGAQPGTTALTLRGTAGALVHATVLNLTVTPAADFTLAAAPAAATVPIPLTAPTTVATTVTLAAVNGFGGTATLGIQGLPLGVTADFTPIAATVPGTATLTLTITSRAQAGTSVLTLHGVSGALDRTTPYTLTLTSTVAPDFTVTPQSPALTVQPGTTDRMTVTLASVGGFGGTVNLAHLDPAPGMVVNFTPNPVTLPAGGTATAQANLSTGPTTPGAVYATTIRATSGAVTHDAPWSITVQDFTLGAAPSSFDFLAGVPINGAGTLNIGRLFGLTNPISLSALAPAGFSLTITPPSTAGNSAAFTFTGPSLTSALPGVHTIPVTGSAGTWSHQTPVIVNIQDYALTLMPSEHTSTGVGFGVQVTATRLAGLPGAITLAMAASAFYNASFTTNPLVGTGSTWNLALGTAVPPGTYTMVLNGTGPLARGANLTVNVVTGANFYIHLANPGTGALQSAVTLSPGGSTTLNAVVNPVAGFVSAPTFSLSSPTAELTATFAPATTATSTLMTLSAGSGLTKGMHRVDVVATFGVAGIITRRATLLVVVP